MGKIAAVFAGQGAQYTGMGRELWERSAAARAVFDMADRICPGTSARCFEGDPQTLGETLYTQPCVCAVDMACAAALAEAGVCAAGAAGFSLGELAGLAYAGLLTQEQAFLLTVRRAGLMHRCAKERDGAMAAVLGLDAGRVELLCGEFSRLYPANYNCPGQTVVAGDRHELETLAVRAAEEGGRAVMLAVGGAFHSPYMAGAADGLGEILSKQRFSQPRIPLFANVTSSPYEAENAADLIAAQVQSPVLWEKTVRRMALDGFDVFIELGPGRVLSGLIKKIVPAARVFHAEDCAGIEKAAGAAKEELYAEG